MCTGVCNRSNCKNVNNQQQSTTKTTKTTTNRQTNRQINRQTNDVTTRARDKNKNKRKTQKETKTKTKTNKCGNSLCHHFLLGRLQMTTSGSTPCLPRLWLKLPFILWNLERPRAGLSRISIPAASRMDSVRQHQYTKERAKYDADKELVGTYVSTELYAINIPPIVKFI